MDSQVQTFLDRVAEVLEVPSVALEDDFRTAPLWSSLSGFALMVMVENEYGCSLTAGELQTLRTVGELARKVGVIG